MNYHKLYNEIKEYALKCVFYNERLIISYQLQNIPELIDYNHFVLPIAAVKKKIIIYKDFFTVNQTDVEYHIHGTGVTFTFDEIRYSFQYFPQIENKNIPIFSISSIYDYMKVVYGYIEQDKFTEVMNELVDEKLITKIDEHGFSFYIPELELSKNTIQ